MDDLGVEFLRLKTCLKIAWQDISMQQETYGCLH